MYFTEDLFKTIFEESCKIIEMLFNIKPQDLIGKSSKHNIVEARKILVWKFYKLKSHDRDKITTWLADALNCRHSNIIYWSNSSDDLYSVDKNFKINCNMFSSHLDLFIKNL